MISEAHPFGRFAIRPCHVTVSRYVPICANRILADNGPRHSQSVSRRAGGLETTLSAEASLAIVDATHEFVDLYKVGKVNYVKINSGINWEDYTHKMIDKLSALGKAHYIKQDLQMYLPKGYKNEMRPKQHH